jgi:hypothetical protein
MLCNNCLTDPELMIYLVATHIRPLATGMWFVRLHTRLLAMPHHLPSLQSRQGKLAWMRM